MKCNVALLCVIIACLGCWPRSAPPPAEAPEPVAVKVEAPLPVKPAPKSVKWQERMTVFLGDVRDSVNMLDGDPDVKTFEKQLVKTSASYAGRALAPPGAEGAAAEIRVSLGTCKLFVEQRELFERLKQTKGIEGAKESIRNAVKSIREKVQVIEGEMKNPAE